MSGTSTTSSWLPPIPMPLPFAVSTPTTRNGMSLIRTVEPIGSASPEQLLLHVLTQHAHLGGAAHVGVGEEHAALDAATGG